MIQSMSRGKQENPKNFLSRNNNILKYYLNVRTTFSLLEALQP